MELMLAGFTLIGWSIGYFFGNLRGLRQGFEAGCQFGQVIQHAEPGDVYTINLSKATITKVESDSEDDL